mgnify:CR=1 FL=1
MWVFNLKKEQILQYCTIVLCKEGSKLNVDLHNVKPTLSCF